MALACFFVSRRDDELMNNDKPNYSFVLNYKKTLLEILSPKETIIHSKDFEVGFFKIKAAS